jgi:hypothetical protein
MQDAYERHWIVQGLTEIRQGDIPVLIDGDRERGDHAGATPVLAAYRARVLAYSIESTSVLVLEIETGDQIDDSRKLGRADQLTRAGEGVNHELVALQQEKQRLIAF